MSNKFSLIQNYFNSGLWSELQLQHAVYRGWITSLEYKTLTGNDYVNLATAPPTTLPEVSSADNGKVIKVVEGEWAKAINDSGSDNDAKKGLHIYLDDYFQIDTELTSPDEDWIDSSLFEGNNNLLNDGIYLHLDNTAFPLLDPSLRTVPLTVDYWEHSNSDDPNTYHLKAKINISYYNQIGIDVSSPGFIDITLTLENNSIIWTFNEGNDYNSIVEAFTYHFKIFEDTLYDNNWIKYFNTIIENDYDSPFLDIYVDFTYYGIFEGNIPFSFPLIPIDIDREEGEESITFMSLYPISLDGLYNYIVTILKNQDPVDEYDAPLLVNIDMIEVNAGAGSGESSDSSSNTAALEAKIQELEAKIDYLTMVTGNLNFRPDSDWSEPVPMI